MTLQRSPGGAGNCGLSGKDVFGKDVLAAAQAVARRRRRRELPGYGLYKPDVLLRGRQVLLAHAVPLGRRTLMLAASSGPSGWVRPAISTITGPPKGSLFLTVRLVPGWIACSAR